MKSQDLLIFPFGGNSREAAVTVDAINRSKAGKRWRLRGFLDDDTTKHGRTFHEAKVLGDRSVAHKKTFKGLLLAIPGHPDRFAQREGIIRSLKWPESRWATIIDPSAFISPDAKIGKNTVILPNVYIGPSVRIGDHCVILPGSVIHHDSVIGDYTMIGSHVTVSGFCRVGRACYIGSGVLLRQDIEVGSGSLLGLGAVIVKKVPSGVVVVGNPGRILRKVA